MARPTATFVARCAAGLSAALLLSACSMAGLPDFAPMKMKPKTVAMTTPAPAAAAPASEPESYELLAFAQTPARVASLDGLISRYAIIYNVPESLVRRVIQRESGYNPRARNGPYLGLMQIRHDT